MKAQYIPCVIFSVERCDLSHAQNLHNKMIAENDMHRMGISFEKLLGVYLGNEETSYLVTDMTKIKQVIGMAREYNQESILLRDNENNCTLKFLSNNDLIPIGQLKQVSVDAALKSDSYTYSYSLKSYFVCS